MMESEYCGVKAGIAEMNGMRVQFSEWLHDGRIPLNNYGLKVHRLISERLKVVLA